MTVPPTETEQKQNCYHCGDVCRDDSYILENKAFCCVGCQTVYQILRESQLDTYYALNTKAGIRAKNRESDSFAYLDLPEIQTQLLSFSDGKTAKVNFFVPAIHCSSCIWLLENLHRLQPAILFSRTDFLKKHLSITYIETEISLRQIVELLTDLGYEPQLTLDEVTQPPGATADIPQTFTAHKKLIARMAVAGFAFGNSMLLSFPEYFGLDTASEHSFGYLFNFLNIVLALPVFFFSGWGYIQSAYRNIRHGVLTVDTPLALGMIVIFLRSLGDIFMGYGPGYMDTLSGFVFFSLVGKWFQQKTYDTLRYDRDFKSYFPVAVTIQMNGIRTQVPVRNLEVGDCMLIRNQELIPADSILRAGQAYIDYSFVTGEALPVRKDTGDVLYAGGRQVGGMIELEVLKPVSQSYLTQLWNDESATCQTCVTDTTLPKNTKTGLSSQGIQTAFNTYFTWVLLGIALISSSYWLIQGEYSRALNAFTSVLIVACPCALVLGSSFALGHAMRILGSNKFYVKNTQTIEEIATIDTIVFDKTGTLTETEQVEITFVAYRHALTTNEKACIAALVDHSNHPLSRHLANHLKASGKAGFVVQDFQECVGKGLSGVVLGNQIRVGSAAFMQEEIGQKPSLWIDSDALASSTRVWVVINYTFLGYFEFSNHYRYGMWDALTELGASYSLHLLSGDGESEAFTLKPYFHDAQHMHFRQTPHDKRRVIQELQQTASRVMMVGDGLNDAGALQQSHVGVAVSDSVVHFTPASDVIAEASVLSALPVFIQFCQQSMQVVRAALVLAVVYNAVGLSFAVQGTLSPLIAAILMPVSSISVIVFTSVAVNWRGRKVARTLAAIHPLAEPALAYPSSQKLTASVL